MKFSKYVQLKESKSENIPKTTLKVRLIDRFNRDSHVTLEELREIATAEQIDYDRVVETICDILQSILYRRATVRDAEVDPYELEIGIKHELEHTMDKKVAKIIAIDHLTHVHNYYTLLKDIDND